MMMMMVIGLFDNNWNLLCCVFKFELFIHYWLYMNWELVCMFRERERRTKTKQKVREKKDKTKNSKHHDERMRFMYYVKLIMYWCMELVDVRILLFHLLPPPPSPPPPPLPPPPPPPLPFFPLSTQIMLSLGNQKSGKDQHYLCTVSVSVFFCLLRKQT